MQLRDAIEDFMLECKVRRLVPRTIDNYGKHLRYLTDYLTAEYQLEKLEDVKSAHIKKFLLMKEEQGCKPHYINDLLKVFKTFFRYCTEEEYIKTNPAKRVHNVRQPKVMIRTFSEEEILKMLNHYQSKDYISIRNKTMLALFFDTGLRLTEVLELRNDQIYDGFVRVMGKGRKERVVPCSPYLAKLLMKHRIMKEAYFEMKNLTPQNYVSLYTMPIPILPLSAAPTKSKTRSFVVSFRKAALWTASPPTPSKEFKTGSTVSLAKPLVMLRLLNSFLLSDLILQFRKYIKVINSLIFF